jgi:hypothetical protein
VSGRTVLPGELGFDAFGTACGLGVVAGALGVVVPSLDLLTLTLVALAVAGWASHHRRPPDPMRPVARPLGAYLGSFVVLAVGTVAFFDAPGPVAPWRGLLLGLTAVPLWVVERGRAARISRGRTG